MTTDAQKISAFDELVLILGLHPMANHKHLVNHIQEMQEDRKSPLPQCRCGSVYCCVCNDTFKY